MKEYWLVGGKADGMRAMDVNNGSGLNFTILIDRSMDFGDVSFKGVNYSYLSKAGKVAPSYFDDKKDG